MPELTVLYELIAKLLPFESMQMRFMQQALIGLLLLAPMTALMGVQVVNFRMAFFADAISHSAFTGVALGLLFAVSPHWTMPVFGLLVGLVIVAAQRRSALSTDTVIGVFFSGVVASDWRWSAGIKMWPAIFKDFCTGTFSPSETAISGR